MNEVRRPKGYVGNKHETIGAVYLSVLKILKMPDQVLGPEEAARLSKVDPTKWYPIGWLLDLMEKLDKHVGHYGLLRMGRALFELSHGDRALKTNPSAHAILHGFDGMYRAANRGGAIGGWRVLLFEPGYAELEKTTPHHCGMEQGILSAALAGVGCPVIVEQKACFRKGADSCLFTVSSPVTDERWFGAPKI